MTLRRKAGAVECISAIGAAAMRLATYPADDVDRALSFLWSANPPVFDWLLQRLAAAQLTHRSKREQA